MTEILKKQYEKPGRPKSKRPYRKNLIRVGALEDTLERILDKLHIDDPSAKLIEEELVNLRLKEKQKYLRKMFKDKSEK